MDWIDWRDQKWRDRADCTGAHPDMFFPPRGASTREAREICGGCMARADCFMFAMTFHQTLGIWGGYSTRERARIKREDRAEATYNMLLRL